MPTRRWPAVELPDGKLGCRRFPRTGEAVVRRASPVHRPTCPRRRIRTGFHRRGQTSLSLRQTPDGRHRGTPAPPASWIVRLVRDHCRAVPGRSALQGAGAEALAPRRSVRTVGVVVSSPACGIRAAARCPWPPRGPNAAPSLQEEASIKPTLERNARARTRYRPIPSLGPDRERSSA